MSTLDLEVLRTAKSQQGNRKGRKHICERAGRKKKSAPPIDTVNGHVWGKKGGTGNFRQAKSQPAKRHEKKFFLERPYQNGASFAKMTKQSRGAKAKRENALNRASQKTSGTQVKKDVVWQKS